MNKRNFFLALLLVAAGMTAWAQGIKVWQNGKAVYYELSTVDSIAFDESNVIDGHEFVDLGLPSGTLWATCNIGAKSPGEYGDFLAWGEFDPKSNYGDFWYEFCKPGTYGGYTKYCKSASDGYKGYYDSLTELEPEDDVATRRWGENWQMPSFEQIQELINVENTTVAWTKQNDVIGAIITSNTNGRSIFLPAGGCIKGEYYDYFQEACLYWSRSLAPNSSSDASYLPVDEGIVEEIETTYRECGEMPDIFILEYDSYLLHRWYGLNVRPVIKRE